MLAPRKVYAAHIRLLVIGENFAKEGMAKSLDFISRGQEFRTDFFIIMVKGAKAADVLQILTPVEKISANDIFDTIETAERAWANAGTVQLYELINDLVSKGKHPVLTAIEIVGDKEKGSESSNLETIDPPTRIRVTNMAAFKGDKFMGWLDEDESRGYNYIAGKVTSTIASLPCKNGENEDQYSIEIIRAKEKIKARMVDGKPKIEVRIEGEGNVGEVECSQLDLTKTDTIKSIEKALNDRAKFVVNSAIKKAQEEFKADIFGFGEAVHREDPKYWRKVEEDWDEVFAGLETEVKADFKIRRTGTVSDSFLNDMKKEK